MLALEEVSGSDHVIEYRLRLGRQVSAWIAFQMFLGLLLLAVSLSLWWFIILLIGLTWLLSAPRMIRLATFPHTFLLSDGTLRSLSSRGELEFNVGQLIIRRRREANALTRVLLGEPLELSDGTARTMIDDWYFRVAELLPELVRRGATDESA